MPFKKRTLTERFFWFVAAIALTINGYYLIAQDNIPKWVRLVNVIG